MAPPKSSDRIVITLDPELSAQVLEAGRALGVDNKPEIIRIMVRQSLQAFPWQDEQQLVAAREGLNSVKHWAFTKLREKLAEIERELSEAGAA